MTTAHAASQATNQAALISTLRGIGEMADARSKEIRELRQLPTDIVERLIDSGVFRSWVPTCYGGRGASAMDLFDAIETVGYYNGSVAWCVMIGGTTPLTSGFLPPAWAQEIYGNPRAVTGGFANPVGRGRLVDGGVRVTGRWGWGSGTAHCTWIGGGVSISEDGNAQAARSDGLKTPFVFFPRQDVKRHDNWHTLGLQGTGSVDYEVNDVFVPEGRWVQFPMREPVVDEPLYRFSTLGALAAGIAFVAVGLARRAIDEAIKLATAKVPAGGIRPLAERSLVQSQIVEAESAWLSARAVLRDQVNTCMQQAASERTISDENRRLLRVAAVNATERSARAVDVAYAVGGGSSIHESSVLLRLFCDVHTATQHGVNGPLSTERLGRMAMGITTDKGMV